MLVIENPDDSSHRTIAQGCDPDFLERLPAHLVFSKRFLAVHGLEQDGTLEQLEEVEKLIATHRKAADWHTRDFFQGLVAYCGELLRPRIPGVWGMLESEPNASYPQRRYFSVIIDAQGQTYSFSSSVESELTYLLNPGLNWDKMDGLYYAMQVRIIRPDFPPSEASELQLPF